MLHQRMFESGTYKSLPEHIALYEALEASMAQAQRDEFLAEKDKSRKRRRNDQDPPPPPDSDLSKRRRHDTGASGSSQPPAPQSSAWKKPVWLKPILEDDRPATPEPAWVIPTSHTFMNWYCQKMGKTELTQSDLKGQDYEVIKAFYPNVVHLQIDINRPLPLSGPPSYVTVQTQFFFNHDLDYLRYGSKESKQALSISKMKAARYHDFGLKLLKFYIDRHTAESSRKVVRTHMRILSVVRIKAYSRYGYDYLKEITLCRADHQEYTIDEKDFKNLYPSDFEDLNLLLFQGHLNHLPGSDIRMLSTAVKLWIRNLVIRQRVEDFQLGIERYQKQLNLTKPGWDTTGFEFKQDYTIIDSPRVVVFPVSNNEWKIMRFNKIYMFSDGTLTNIMEALDYRVKEYKVNRLNSGMNTRFWTDKDVERSKEFIHAIERRLKTRRIF
ncbi:hypothetical protein Tco_0525048 [Tanacetum coccineum]